MNEEIVKRIKKVRTDKGLTQQDLANHLGKTAAAISDLERGKVQVSAADLFKISTLLEKPIQYFYGETLLREEDEEFLLEAQKIRPGSLKEITIFMRLAWRMGDMLAYLSTNYKTDEIISREDTEKFYEILMPYFGMLEERMNKALEMKRKIDRGMDNVPKLDE